MPEHKHTHTINWKEKKNLNITTANDRNKQPNNGVPKQERKKEKKQEKKVLFTTNFNSPQN